MLFCMLTECCELWSESFGRPPAPIWLWHSFNRHFILRLTHSKLLRQYAVWHSCNCQGSQRAWEILENSWIWNKNFKALESAWKQIRCLKVVENPWKVLEFKSCKFWNFVFVDSLKQALVCMSPVLGWRQSVTCFYHYSIGDYSTVHFSVTLQSKFWMSASRIWLFMDNFGAWKMQFGSLKSAWVLYFEFTTIPELYSTSWSIRL